MVWYYSGISLLFSISVEDLWKLYRIASSLKEGGFRRIGAPQDEDSPMIKLIEVLPDSRTSHAKGIFNIWDVCYV